MIGPKCGQSWPRFLGVGLLTMCMFGSSAVPGFAQQAPTAGSWSAGPGATGNNTYVGRIESPRAGQSVADGTNVLVSGWALDTTARGWAGFDALEVWSGDKDASSAKKLATGSVGLSRPDIAEALGGAYASAGFSATLPSSALTTLEPGKRTVGVYLHTPSKGWWHKSVGITLLPAKAATDAPINTFLRPLDGTIITQKQKFDKYTLFGYALDLTPISDSGNQTLGSCECGISSVSIYADAVDARHLLGTAALDALVGFANTGKPHWMPTADFSPVSREYGTQYDKAGWFYSINPTTLTADWHTFYAVARSSITGKTSTDQVTMMIKAIPDRGKILAP